MVTDARVNAPIDGCPVDLLIGSSSLVSEPARPVSVSPFLATVVIPAYNEERGLPVVLNRLSRAVDGRVEILVVDDGSSDSTSHVASQCGVRVIRHKHNLGKGQAMLTGIGQAQGDSVIFIDADGTYPPEVIPLMIRALQSCEAVYCSRRGGRNHIPLANRLGNALFQRLMRHVYGFHASDYSTGLYGIKRDRLQQMNVRSCRFAIEPEIAIKATRMNLRVVDIPVQYEQRIGQTKLSGLEAGWQHLKVMVSLVFWRPRRGLA